MKKSFKFCPNCGHSSQGFELQRLFCNHCDFVYYQNVATATAVLLLKGDEILFTVRNKEPQKGKLDLPGGFTDPDETAERTCQRELNEELGIHIPLDQFTYFMSRPNDYLYKDIDYKTCDLAFIAQFPVGDTISIEEEEIQAVKWIHINEINLEEIGFSSLRNVVENYLNSLK